VLRVVLRSTESLAEWDQIEQYVASVLLKVECYRTIERLRLMGQLSDEQVAGRFEALQQLLRHLELIELTPALLDRAAGSFFLPVKTLDAIHLATSLAWRQTAAPGGVFATHDRTLGLAARTLGFPVIGL
jgi:predicted nucleic acid-binding protein